MTETKEKRGLLVFDLDGTLLDTLDDLTAAVDQALRAHGLPERSRDEVRGFVGNGVHKLIERALPRDVGPELESAVFTTFAAWYKEHCADLTRPYPGIEDMLRRLPELGWAAAVVSNKSDREVQALCRRFFPSLLDMVAGERPGLAVKPAPDLPYLVLTQLGYSPEQAVYIGDSQVDIETARRASLFCICVSWGFRSREQLIAAGADLIADDPGELLALLPHDK